MCDPVPKAGDVFFCEACGMQFTCTADCPYDDMTEDKVLQCCGEDLTRKPKQPSA